MEDYGCAAGMIPTSPTWTPADFEGWVPPIPGEEPSRWRRFTLPQAVVCSASARQCQDLRTRPAARRAQLAGLLSGSHLREGVGRALRCASICSLDQAGPQRTPMNRERAAGTTFGSDPYGRRPAERLSTRKTIHPRGTKAVAAGSGTTRTLFSREIENVLRPAMVGSH